MAYLINLLIALDQLANALLVGAPDETLSSRAYRADRDGRLLGVLCRFVIDMAFFWQPSHCKQAYQAELARRQYPTTFK